MQTERLFDRIDSIQFKGVTKKYGTGFAVKDLDLEIKGGELLFSSDPVVPVKPLR